MKKKILIAVVVFVLAASFLLITSCGNNEGMTINPGVLTVGSDATWPPMEFVEGDKIVGFDVDLTQEIADRLDLELSYQNAAWDGIFPALIVHKYDMVISSVTITEDRLKEMDFSIPYFQTDQSFTVLEDSDIDSVEKLNGKIAGVQLGTTGDIAANEIEGLDVNTYDDILLAYEDLKAGRVDTVVSDSYMGFAFVMNNEGLKTGLVIKTDEELGIAFAKDTSELLEAVNEVLAEIIDDGTYDEIFAKWFGKG